MQSGFSKYKTGYHTYKYGLLTIQKQTEFNLLKFCYFRYTNNTINSLYVT